VILTTSRPPFEQNRPDTQRRLSEFAKLTANMRVGIHALTNNKTRGSDNNDKQCRRPETDVSHNSSLTEPR
jgi:hypothetical protein